MVFVMALLGAVTRLTQAGLSITDWAPLIGIIPPLRHDDWARAFAAYQQIPQYQMLHTDMTLDSFKGIYFWEWLHRLWGRLIGVAFAVPLAAFWWRGRIGRQQGLRFVAVFMLGGLQGFIGWFMVESGLVDRTSVSPYRLALHLGFALLIYSLLLWMAVAERTTDPIRSSLRRQGWLALAVLALTMMWGAFVAGLQAGMVYNTWPLMADEFLPSIATSMRPLWRNAFENVALVQFIHRWMGPLTMILVLSWVGHCWKTVAPARKPALAALAVMATLQVGLGLATLLSQVQIQIAVLHQAGAITLLTLLLYNLIMTRRTNRSTQTETAKPYRQSANTMPPPSDQNGRRG